MTKKRTHHRRNAHGRPGAKPGEQHHFARLSDAEVDQMRAMYAEGCWSYSTLAEKFDMSKSAVADIIQGRRRGPNEFRVGDGVDDLC